MEILLTGTVTADTDIAVSPPDHAKKVGLATVSTLPTKTVMKGGTTFHTPYIPGSTLRGAIRNALSKAALKAQADADNAMTPEDYLRVAKGGIKDRKTDVDERVADLELIQQVRSSNPIISLFGAMADKIEGHLRIFDMVPQEPVEPNWKGHGVRSHPFQREPELTGLVDKAALADFLEADAKRVEGNIHENDAEALDRKIRAEKRKDTPDLDKLEKMERERKEHSDAADACFEAAGGAVNIQQILGGYEAIPEGTVMEHRMHGCGLSPDELAFVMLGLRKLAREGRFGAHGATGCGYFTAEYALRFAVDSDAELAPAGKIRIADFRLDLDTDVTEISEAFQRSATILDDVSGFAFKGVA